VSAVDDAPTVSDRLVAALAALVFSVPTVSFVWFALNIDVASFGAFVGTTWLWGVIVAFSVLAFFSPTIFVDAMGAVWRLLARVARFW
jgi:hypothetical protein